MKFSLGKTGEAYIKSKETLSLKAYMPTPEDVPTIGWGHTDNVKMETVIDINTAQIYFNNDISGAVYHSNLFLDKHQKVKFNQSQFDSLVSLVFNAGLVTIEIGSSIELAAQNGDMFKLCQSFFLWRKQAGKDKRGLALRRTEEMCMFLSDRFLT